MVTITVARLACDVLVLFLCFSCFVRVRVREFVGFLLQVFEGLASGVLKILSCVCPSLEGFGKGLSFSVLQAKFLRLRPLSGLAVRSFP